MRVLIHTVIGGGIAISPAAYYETLEICKERANALRLHNGFVSSCLEEAKAKGIRIYLYAQGKDWVDSICKYRAMWDLFSGEDKMPGTLCEDLTTRSDVPVDCKYVMVGFPRRYASTAESLTTVDGRFVSEALTRLVAVHASGFMVNLEPDLGSFGRNAVLHLDTFRMSPLVPESGQIDDQSIRGVKADLENFHEGLVDRFEDKSLIRDFGNWIRRIRIDRTEIPAPAEYAEWINRFANIKLRKRKAGEISEAGVQKVVIRTPLVAEFLSLYSNCRFVQSLSVSHGEINKGDEFQLLESKNILTVGDEIPGGINGDVFRTSDPNLIIKIAFDASDYCYEFAGLLVLNGLGGRSPELYDVDNPVPRMMVMRRVGETGWPMSDNPERPSNEHLAQVIEIVRDLHEAGFVHRDLYERNIRMDPDRVYLIDFGMLRPMNTSGGDPLDTRRVDMIILVENVITLQVQRALEMLADMEALGDDERPDYEKWIAHFRSSP